jgi:predicted nucleotide-binding protein (sugar kinase/HSP70/actin superfamily)
VPRMCDGAAKLWAACLRAVGFEAKPCPEADERALEVALRYTSGDECYPQRVTVAEFIKAMEDESFDSQRAVFLMATTTGPCRFGQYSLLLERILHRMGKGDIPVVSLNSDTGYREVAEEASGLNRLMWWGAVVSDLLRRVLHRTRPYEARPGQADSVHEWCVEEASRVIESSPNADREKLERLVRTMEACRDRFSEILADESRDRPLIGVVGEIFCRLNPLTNEDVIRKIDALGGEAWLSGVGEWVWYVNCWELETLRIAGRRLSKDMFSTWLSCFVQRMDEARLSAPFHGMLSGREDPHKVEEILELAQPYLPWRGALGEMVLSVGKAIYLQRKGVDGVVDVSPFGCMNGVVSEAVYPAVSRDNGGIPIRNFYFDGSGSDAGNAMEIFMELAANYRRTRISARSQES